MSARGMPWRADVHDALLAGLLGRRPGPGFRPPRLAELAAQISAAFGGRPVNPDSPAQLLKAFATDGVPVQSTRSGVLRAIDHPAVPFLLEYKELARLHAAHGWAWLDEWVRGGRFHPEYVVGGVVGPLGQPWRRRAADSAGGAPCGRCGSRLGAGGRGRGATGAAGARRARRRSRVRGSGRVRRPVPGAGRGVRRRPGQGQGGAAVRDVRRGWRRGRPAAGRAPAALPPGRRLRGSRGPRRGGGPGGPVPARPVVPAAVRRVAGPHRVGG